MAATRRIREGLAAATCTLLGLGSARATAADMDSALLFYSEIDRVSLVEAVVDLRQEIDETTLFTGKIVVDVLTGASANGATPSRRIQTFTRPSGKASYTVQPGDTPLDHIFQDTRLAVTGDLRFPLSRLSTATIGTSFSIEYDYQSVGVHGFLSRDFNRRNTSVRAGFSLAYDRLDPEGGIPIPFATMQPVGPDQPRRGDTDDKTVADFLLGITQIVGQRTLFQINYSLGRSAGYQTDPFKIISVIDAAPGPDQGEPLAYVFEHRPDRRIKQSFHGRIKHAIGHDMVDGSYRFLWDDWGIRSHTVETRYRHDLGGVRFLEPQIRLYHQSAAQFYRHSLVQGAAFPAFASADYRLAELNAITLALKYGTQLGGRKFNLRLGYYLQMGDSSPPDAIGVQRDLDLIPDVGAIMVQFGYAFGV